MLVLAPRPLPTESLMGYVLRLTEINGYPSISYLLSGLDGKNYKSSIGRHDANLLSNYTDITKDEIERLSSKTATLPRAFIRINGIDLPAFEVTLNRPKVCSICLSKGMPCEAFWDLAQAIACPIHQVYLIDHCSVCKKNLTWYRGKMHECKCGADLTKFKTVPASKELCELMALMRYQLYKNETIAIPPQSLNHIAHLDLRRLCKLLWIFCSVLYKRNSRMNPKSRFHYKEQLCTLSEILSDWPNGFRKYLNDKYTDYLINSDELPNFNMLFNWILVRLIKHDKSYSNQFEFLERELYEFGSKYWPRDAMARDNNSKLLMPVNMRWGTISEASEISGMHWATLRKRISVGEVKIRVIRNIKTNRGILVDLDSIREQKISKYPPVSLRKAAPTIGISIETLRELRKTGDFKEVFRSQFPNSFSFEDVNEFKNKIVMLGYNKKKCTEPDVTTVKKGFISFVASPAEKAGFISFLLSDASLVIGSSKSGGIDNYQVKKSVISKYINQARSNKPKCMSRKEASVFIGCSIAVITALVDAGYIKVSFWGNKESPTVESVHNFNDMYIGIFRMTEQFGIGYKYAYAHLNFELIEHIKVKSLQYSTVFIVRSEQEKVKKMLNVQ